MELCAKKKAQGKNVTESALIQHHTEEELVIGILHIAKSEKTIRNAIRALAKKHAISILKNPNGRKGFDRTKHYRFHPEFLNAWLEAANGKITECTTTPDSKEQSAENQHSSSIGKTTESNRENYRVQTVNLPNANGKITEISPETTIEITTENTHWARKKFTPSSHFSPPTSTTTGKGRFVFTMSECPFCDENGEFTCPICTHCHGAGVQDLSWQESKIYLGTVTTRIVYKKGFFRLDKRMNKLNPFY
ncbi:MAG: hypothetical protein B6247_14050 [Candidatus Parabeggiatoa sp. nov. 2]|nr:MAG: hypothetical protein B6247_14050 [Beggiatoa sp. 4572_84]